MSNTPAHWNEQSDKGVSVWLGAGEPVCVCVCAPNLTRYHMKTVLKAFSLEQEPQAMVMSWDIPLGATCGEGNSREPRLIMTPVLPLPLAGAESSQGPYRGQRTRAVLEGVGLGGWAQAFPRVAEKPREALRLAERKEGGQKPTPDAPATV